MLPPERIVALLSTITGIVTSSALEAKLHNHIRLCLDILYSTDLLENASIQVAHGARQASEITTLLHKLRTRISSLLQSRASQARWAGVCLVKAGIETSPAFLQGVAIWIPMLLRMVNRPEQGSPITERAIAVLTRIFVLTTSKTALTRELTSPYLPTFSQSLLSPAVRSSGNLLAVLRSIHQILQTHPTTFRPQQQKALELVRSILFAEDDKNYPSDILEAATAAYVGLVRCTPSKTQAEEWVRLFKDTISTTEQTCDILFECLIEEKDSDKLIGQRRRADSVEVHHLLSPERVGVRRVCNLLQILQAFLSQPANFTPPISIPLSPLISLLQRLCFVYPGIKTHPSAAPSTYHLLLAAYPNILQAAIPVISTLVSRLYSFSPSLALEFLHPVAFISTTSKDTVPVQVLCYHAISHFISLIGRTLSPKDVQPLLEVFSSACEDIIPPTAPVIVAREPDRSPGSMLLTQPTTATPTSTYRKRKAPTPQNKANTPAASSIHADQFLTSGGSSTNNAAAQSDELPLVKAAKQLLTVALLNIQSAAITSELRSRIERTMVLSAHAPGLLAAVLYPATKRRGGSLLPHLMAIYDKDATNSSLHGQGVDQGVLEANLVHMAVEGLVYPRMQVIKTSGQEDRGPSVVGSPVEPRYLLSPRGAMSVGTAIEAIPPASLEEVLPQPPPPELDTPMEPPPGEEENYPPPPPAPVPQHAKLPATASQGALGPPTPVPPPAQQQPQPQPLQPQQPQPQQPQQSSGAMSPPQSIPASLPRNNGTAGTNANGVNTNSSGSGGGDRNMFIPMAMPSPRGGVHAVLPPSPLRQSMTILEAEDDANEKLGRKRLKVDGGAVDAEVAHSTSASPTEALVGKVDEDDDDDDADIPEIVMGDSEDEGDYDGDEP
ncbi:Pre-rRNA-processing protein rix1 [Drechslerella dactyloides]|uniref:Pre-rRNA-processing protein RIX1 n=1 Tax=Drechslerella dactyloides TaxID=74499 RepID=A0AAD6J4Z6_DREDA|nr:Pre-rRNA-processing protein rix1 [Drechslerella dactyloides]